MKNKLIDLNNALFLQLEKIQNPEDGEDLTIEIRKAEAINITAKNIIDIHKIVYQAAKQKGADLDYLDNQFCNNTKAIDK